MASVQVVTLGEAMIRLTPVDHQRLETTPLLEVHIGGAELNVAVALAQLGVPVAWVSKLPNNPLGRRVVQEAQRFGVDTSQVVWTQEGRVGLYFYEKGSSPRPSTVVYDRRHSAINTLKVDELDWDFIGQAKILHLTGITPALSDICKHLVAGCIVKAKERRMFVSFDVNYRSRLWTPEQARVTLLSLLRGVDLLICTKDDAATLFNLTVDIETIARQLQASLRIPNVAVTHGDKAVVATTQGTFSQTGYQIEEVDRLGAGDAFAAGLLYGILQGNWELGLRYGLAMAAIKHTIPGDWFIGTKAEIEAIMQAQQRGVVR
ncbi:MAG: sugar kinase [Armatimonadetes bacterium]|nr:sugar kinase [Armatimonadota bacterium]MCX7967433.1 sugar kinase [Armatimonadota bacterium]MDW8142079.1 sugar kinase [Armatimonadota bacterium]